MNTKVNISVGELIYIKKAKRGPTPSHNEITFQGRGVAILLGAQSDFGSVWTRAQVMTSMANIGFGLLEEVKEFLGEEKYNEFREKFNERYYSPTQPDVVTPTPSKILGLSGLPLGKR